MNTKSRKLSLLIGIHFVSWLFALGIIWGCAISPAKTSSDNQDLSNFVFLPVVLDLTLPDLATATPTSTPTGAPAPTATSTPTPTPFVYVREAEDPDEFTVGTQITRSSASNLYVHGQFGCTAGGLPQAGYVKYLNINIPNADHLYFRIRYSKASSLTSTIEIYLDDEATPRAFFIPQNQGNWNLFTWTNEMDLGAVTGGLHSLKLNTNGQQFCTADLDIFTLTELSDQMFLDMLTHDTWNYLSSDWATNNHLPWSWRSNSSPSGDYANPAEIGLYSLSWIAAYEMQYPWSPGWPAVEVEIGTVLDQLRAWQTGSQPPGVNGPNAYNNSVFYQYYYISANPPSVGDTNNDQTVPSIDNAWLAMSLLTIREYAEQNGHPDLAQKADDVLTDMDFSPWYDATSNYFYWGGFQNPQAGGLADTYSNENRIINFIARALGDLDATEFQESLNVLTATSGTYNGITVEKVAYDGSIFTYLAPALFIREMETNYGPNTISQAVLAQMAYAHDSAYVVWGLSDCYDLGSGELITYLHQGAPPANSPDPLEEHPGVIAPHASVLALISQYSTESLANLHILAEIFPNSYEPTYGFYDSVMAHPPDFAYGDSTDRFSALAQEWILLSVANLQTNFIWDYLYIDEGVITAHTEMFGSPPPSP